MLRIHSEAASFPTCPKAKALPEKIGSIQIHERFQATIELGRSSMESQKANDVANTYEDEVDAVDALVVGSKP